MLLHDFVDAYLVSGIHFCKCVYKQGEKRTYSNHNAFKLMYSAVQIACLREVQFIFK